MKPVMKSAVTVSIPTELKQRAIDADLSFSRVLTAALTAILDGEEFCA